MSKSNQSGARVNPTGPEKALATAHRLLKAGFHPVILYPAGVVIDRKRGPETGKRPMGAGWGKDRITPQTIDDRFQRYPEAGVGICLGPGKGPGDRWPIDLEGDGREAKDSLINLCGGELVATLGWSSARGDHRLYFGDPGRLPEIVRKLATKGTEPGVIHLPELPGLELRIGQDGKQIQSACPPTVGTDGQPRRWDECRVIAELPESAYAFLEGIIRDRAATAPPPPPPPPPDRRNGRPAPLARAAAYLARCQPAVSGQRGHNKCFGVACKVGPGFDLSYEDAYNLLWEEYNPRCQPPWTEQELEHKLTDAYDKEGHRLGWLLKADRPEYVGPDRKGQAAPDADRAAQAAGRPIIECHDRGLDTVTTEAIAALAARNDPPDMFNFGDLLAWIRTAGDDGRAMIEPMSPPAVRNRLADVAVYRETRPTKEGDSHKLIFPPIDIVRAVMARKSWPDRMAPPLELIAESPRFLPDGRLVTTPGYHRAAGIFYDPPPELLGLTVPDRPTPGQVDEATNLIFNEYLYDFPFADAASKANALACMLLPFVRLLINGPTPLHLFEASTEGTGKGKLANACAFPALGRDLHSTAQREDEGEWRKSITTALLPGPGHIYFDNMYNPRLWDGSMVPIDSANLALALTQPEWRDRILGGNREARIKIRCTWMASGNNVEWSKELIRRVVPIRLIAPTENPSERTGFKHDPLERWAAANRVALLRACLTLCRNWLVEDRTPGRQVMGSYEEYARVLGGILDAACVPGFLANRKRGMGKDRESLRWAALVEVWAREIGAVTTAASHLYDIIVANRDLNISFADIMGEGKELSQKQKLGNALQKQLGRVWGNHRIIRSAQKGTGGTVRYRLVPKDTLIDEEPEPDNQ